MRVTTGLPLRPLTGALAALALLLCACGGGSDGDSGGGGGGLSEKRAGELAEQYVLNVFGILTGDVKPQELIDSFAPECREGVKASDIAAAIGFISIFVPQLADAKIEDVDLGKLKFEKTDEGILVTPEDPNAIRIKVDGKFVNADEFFSELGFDDSGDDSPADAAEALLIVERDGKAYLGECSELQDFSGADSEDPVPTPSNSGTTSTRAPSNVATLAPSTSTSTPAAGTNRPGGTRATAVSLGANVVVEGTWRVSVTSVNKDAADVVEANSFFFEEPAANERMVLITVKAENISKDDEAQSIGDFEFNLTGSRNQLYNSYDDEYSCGFLEESLQADLFPGGQASGDICFRVPRDETNLLLVYDGFIEGDTYLKLD